MQKTDQSISDDKLHALVDGRLPAAQRSALLAQISGKHEAQETLRAWQLQRAALRELQRELLVETIPANLVAAARPGRHSQQFAQWWRWGGMAASVMLVFAVGWLAHRQFGEPASRMAYLRPAPAQTFALQAAAAHVVFSPEVRHPVEVAAAQQDHLVQWLSKRLGKPLKVPLLTAQGYELVGGRLLPAEGGTHGLSGVRAQFMFQNQAGLRVTLYLGALDLPSASKASSSSISSSDTASQETAFSYTAAGPVPSFYWVDRGFGYALSGPLPRQELMQLAQLVYQQL